MSAPNEGLLLNEIADGLEALAKLLGMSGMTPEAEYRLEAASEVVRGWKVAVFESEIDGG